MLLSRFVTRFSFRTNCPRRAAHEGSGPDHDRHHGATQGHHFPDRRQAAARGDQRAQPFGQEARGAAAAVLPAHRQVGGDDGGALCPRQAVQPPSPTVAHPTHAARLHHPRYSPQDHWPAGPGGGVPMAARLRQSDPFAATAPAWLEAVFLPRSRGRMHRQGQGQRTL